MANCRHCGLMNAIRENTCIHCGTRFGELVPEYRGSQSRGGPSTYAELRQRLCSHDGGEIHYQALRRPATTEDVAEVEPAGVK
jgi:hypothetical protein